MTDFRKIHERVVDQSRRLWAVRHYLMTEATSELKDVQTMIDELDRDWEAMERLHTRIRHHVRRLQNKLATDGNPLSESDRNQHIGKVPPRGGW